MGGKDVVEVTTWWMSYLLMAYDRAGIMTRRREEDLMGLQRSWCLFRSACGLVSMLALGLGLG